MVRRRINLMFLLGANFWSGNAPSKSTSQWKSVLLRARGEPRTWQRLSGISLRTDRCLENEPTKTLYDLIGAQASDDPETLKKAFRGAARASHPDLHPDDPHALFRFRQVIAANSILRDAKQRAVYDQLLQRATANSILRDAKPRVTCNQSHSRRQVWSKTTRTTVAIAIMAALVGGYGLFAPLPTTAVVAVFADMNNARGPVETTGAQSIASNPEYRAQPDDKNVSVESRLNEQTPDVLPNEAGFYTKRGIAAYRGGDFSRAIIEFDEAIRRDPNDAKAYNIRGNA